MKKSKLDLKNNRKGITLIALVITIIVLLILAGVTIATLTGDNGILIRANEAKVKTEESTDLEIENLGKIENYIEDINNNSTLDTVTGEETENSKLQDSLGNVVWVPAGFKVINPHDNVEDGIIIEDVTYEETKGSQFVWIPVGNFKLKNGETKNIVLDRYDFDIENGKENKYEGKFKEDTVDNHDEEFENSIAKDINTFKSKSIEKEGFYIGRYESRTTKERTNSEEELSNVTVNPNDYIYNFVKQSEASTLSQNMYKITDKFTTDLINSYAWDTSLVFFQIFEENYSNKISPNTIFEKKGTNNSLNINEVDDVCNIYDMAGNCREWTTETSDYAPGPNVGRGGVFGQKNNYARSRTSLTNAEVNKWTTFRAVLYL